MRESDEIYLEFKAISHGIRSDSELDQDLQDFKHHNKSTKAEFCKVKNKS